MNNVVPVIFKDARQITYFCNEVEPYGRIFKCKLKVVKDNSVYPASLLAILKIGFGVPMDIIIESHNGDNIDNAKKCKESIERWFKDYGNNNEN